MGRRSVLRNFRLLLRLLLVCVIVVVLVVIFIPESRFSVFLRRHFERSWPAAWRTVQDEPEGGISILFAPCRKSDPNGIDDRLTALIDSADTQIKAAIYDLDLENVAGAILNAYERGVNVAMVCDGTNRNRQIERLEGAGIPVTFRHPGDGLMHNKFVVVDGRKVWTGSMNMTSNGAYRNNNNALIFDSVSIADNFSAEFEEMRQGLFGTASPENTPSRKVFIDDSEVETFFAPEDGVEQQILSEIRLAKKEIIFMAFAFTSEPIAELMARKIEEGIVVRGVIERSQRSRFCRFDYLRKAGADVTWDSNRYSMHHKVIVIDGTVAITGSYNFSKSANTRNDENCVIVRDPGIAAQFLREFDRIRQ